MYAAVITAQIQPGKRDEVIGIIQDSIVPVAKQQQGFKSWTVLTDPHTDKFTSVALWETEADATRIATSGVYQREIAKIASLFAGPPTREQYEVSIQV